MGIVTNTTSPAGWLAWTLQQEKYPQPTLQVEAQDHLLRMAHGMVVEGALVFGWRDHRSPPTSQDVYSLSLETVIKLM